MMQKSLLEKKLKVAVCRLYPENGGALIIIVRLESRKFCKNSLP